jgi:hypothetical protein
MTHQSTFRIDAQGRGFMECRNPVCHGHSFEVTDSLEALVRLGKVGRKTPKLTGCGPLDLFVWAIVADQWAPKTSKGILKKDLRRHFPGIGGDMLNDVVERLLSMRHIITGSCRLCYGLPPTS